MPRETCRQRQTAKKGCGRERRQATPIWEEFLLERERTPAEGPAGAMPQNWTGGSCVRSGRPAKEAGCSTSYLQGDSGRRRQLKSRGSSGNALISDKFLEPTMRSNPWPRESGSI